jgi:hypothetical protein
MQAILLIAEKLSQITESSDIAPNTHRSPRLGPVHVPCKGGATFTVGGGLVFSDRNRCLLTFFTCAL